MVTVKDAEQYLRKQIGEHTDDIQFIWEAFKAFGKQPVEGEEEIALLVECGVYDFTGKAQFHFNFTRQFTVYEGEEYVGMEQLHALFLFEAKETLESLKMCKWFFSNEGTDVEEFYTEIENAEEFKLAMKGQPISFQLYQDEV
ncbi:hypothetical protein SY83_04860 [Paenibacillus swuensis]|uniref:Uncharacterized protein n=1 Tax=Paenibacillus swuensis TaxID=1178515 RepID=A0A172TFA9_9BACL|nr:hypothetical protein [Paenibacillus swuensis]ANE45739.1 hypothetical protein SY83_04860 [Paenibacillus swuensis]